MNRVLDGVFMFHLIGNGWPNTIHFFGFMSDKSTSESEHLLVEWQCFDRQRNTDKRYYMWIRAHRRNHRTSQTRFKASWMASVALLCPHDAYILWCWHTKNSNVKTFCIILLQTFGIRSRYWLWHTYKARTVRWVWRVAWNDTLEMKTFWPLCLFTETRIALLIYCVKMDWNSDTLAMLWFVSCHSQCIFIASDV